MTVFTTWGDRVALFSKRVWIKLLIAGAVWLVVAFCLWWQFVYATPKQVFEGMLANNFSTTSFVRHTTDQRQGAVGVDERAQLQLGAQNVARIITTLKQGEDTVVTDAIGTPSAEYVRYKTIDTPRQNANGQPLDFSRALHKWAEQPVDVSSSQTFSQLALGIFPMGNLQADDRRALLDYIRTHNVFSVKYDTLKKEWQDGRYVYVYEVQLLPQPYVDMLRQFGEAVGLGAQTEALNAADYASAAPTDMVVTVDVLSRQLRELSFPGGTRVERYQSYGAFVPVELPAATITTTELQELLSAEP